MIELFVFEVLKEVFSFPAAAKTEEECVFGVSLGGASGDGEEGVSGGSHGLWEDEETQRFYEDLPNIQEYLPGRSKDNKDTASPETAEPVSQVISVLYGIFNCIFCFAGYLSKKCVLK